MEPVGKPRDQRRPSPDRHGRGRRRGRRNPPRPRSRTNPDCVGCCSTSRTSWKSRGRAGRRRSRRPLRLIGGDFFTEVPTGGDAYVLAGVLCDWQDNEARQILRQCRQAMGANAQIQVVEALIPEGNESSPSKNIDIQLMLTNAGGGIRSETEWRSLLDNAGFNRPTIVTTEGISDVLPRRACVLDNQRLADPPNLGPRQQAWRLGPGSRGGIVRRPLDNNASSPRGPPPSTRHRPTGVLGSAGRAAIGAAASQ